MPLANASSQIPPGLSPSQERDQGVNHTGVQVLTADDAAFEKGTAERLAALLEAVQKRWARHLQQRP